MKLDIMRSDEEFFGIFDNKIVIKKKNGEVRIVTIVLDQDGIRVDKDSEMIIGYGDGRITVGNIDDGIEVTTF